MTAPEPYFTDGQVRLFLGDCLDVLPTLPDSSIDSVVTDPPYGLEFMGREWDTFKPAKSRIRTRADQRTNPAEGKSVVSVPESYTAGQPFQAWCFAWASECLRVLKPGACLLAFGGTRTWHRLACAVEDAGFEIRDSVADLTGQDAPGLMWVYGGGFPKSADAARSIDMQVCQLPGRHCMRQVPANPKPGDHVCPESGESEPWRGFGTALKPAWEPIVVGRKPLAGTMAQNLLAHGNGALNIGACRVEFAGADDLAESEGKNRHADFGSGPRDNHVFGADGRARAEQGNYDGSAGRWPANVLLTHSAGCEPVGTREIRTNSHHPSARGGSGYEGGLHGQSGLAERKSGTEVVQAWDCAPECPVAELDRQSGVLTSGANPARRGSGTVRDAYGEFAGQAECTPRRGAESGGASRFFPQFSYSADDLVFFPVKSDTCEQPGDESTMAANTSAGRKTESSDDSSPTDGSGNRQTAPSPTGTRSTTEITTNSTTTSATSCASLPSGTTTTISGSASSIGGSTESSSAIASGAESGSPSSSTTSGEPEPGRGTACLVNANTGASGSAHDATNSTRNGAGGAPWDSAPSFPAFRWQAKAPASERPRLADGTAHPTVKPLELMRWLVRLVTPPGGTVADPFAGSGTTGEACIIEGFNCVLIEKDPASAELIKARLSKPIQPLLFGEEAS